MRELVRSSHSSKLTKRRRLCKMPTLIFLLGLCLTLTEVVWSLTTHQSVPLYPSYNEFLEPNVVRGPVLQDSPVGFLPSLVQSDGGEYGEQGCSHLKAAPCDGKLENTIEKSWWMLYMASATTDRIDLDTVACVDRCVYDTCTAIKARFTHVDTGSYCNEIWGTDGQYITYLKQTIVMESQKFYIFRSRVDDIEKADVQNQKYSPATRPDALKQNLESASFVVLGGKYDQFIVLRSCSKNNPVVFVYLREDLYKQTDEQKKQIFHDVDVVLYDNNINNRRLKFFKDLFPGSQRLPQDFMRNDLVGFQNEMIDPFAHPNMLV